MVQQLRKNKRRPNRTGIVSMFLGLMYCADCGAKLYYSSEDSKKSYSSNFFCSSFRKDSDACSMHYIREKVIYDLVLADLQRVCAYVSSYEAEFVRAKKETLANEKRRELTARKRALEKSRGRRIVPFRT